MNRTSLANRLARVEEALRARAETETLLVIEYRLGPPQAAGEERSDLACRIGDATTGPVSRIVVRPPLGIEP